MEELLKLAIFGKVSASLIADFVLTDKQIEQFKDKVPYWYSVERQDWTELGLEAICNRALYLRTLKGTNI